MKLKLITVTSAKLTKKIINEICILKNQYWKFSLDSQKNWFKKNVKTNDIHNLLFLKSKLIGYTLLRKRKCKLLNDHLYKKTTYLLFDTLIIHKKYRTKKFSNLLMNYNNKIIKKYSYFSFLMCNDNLIEFYQKHKWKKINNKKIHLIDHSYLANGMIFNNKITKIKKYVFFTNN